MYALIYFARVHLERSNDGCVNRDITLAEKLALNAAFIDNNKDGLVTTADINNDMINNYDTDSEFCIADPQGGGRGREVEGVNSSG